MWGAFLVSPTLFNAHVLQYVQVFYTPAMDFDKVNYAVEQISSSMSNLASA